MSSLLNKYQNSRRPRYESQNVERIYPSLSGLNERDQTKYQSSYSDRFRVDQTTRQSPIREDASNNHGKSDAYYSKRNNENPYKSSTEQDRTYNNNKDRYLGGDPYKSTQLPEYNGINRKYSTSFKKESPTTTRRLADDRDMDSTKYNTELNRIRDISDKYISKTTDHHLRSPIKSLRTPISGVRRSKSSLYKVLDSPAGSSTSHRVSKVPRKSTQRQSGILSRLVNYFTHDEIDEIDALKKSAKDVLRLDPITEKKVSFHSDIDDSSRRKKFGLNFEDDPVDDTIRSRKIYEQRNIEVERYREREEDYKQRISSLETDLLRAQEREERIARDLGSLQRENEETVIQLRRDIAHLEELRASMVSRQELLNAKEQISQLRERNKQLLAENNSRVPAEELAKAEEQISQLRERNNQLIIEGKSKVPREDLFRAKDENSQLRARIDKLKVEVESKVSREEMLSAKEQLLIRNKELDDLNFELKNSLEECRKDLQSQIEKNKLLNTEMNMREKLRLASEELEQDRNLLFNESAQISRKLQTLQNEFKSIKQSKSLPNIEDKSQNKYQKTEKNIETAIDDLNEYTKALSRKDLTAYETFYSDVKKFLDDSKSELRKAIGASILMSENNDEIKRYYSSLFSNLYTLRRLCDLSYSSLRLKALISTCKVLESFKTSEVDVADIYQRLALETLN
ncbi:uncharacterized protein J8A68_002691 [[Candida] subhashii]|uniref:Uncharacterized protein n=1 Tax=[Candida] subhashii TaxID=561895 RepID=A0A8J5QG27_9ASCO|nr:uncharacterized protein J8A68_002691 [[Candida] subhashii]KAG7663831.1 hypothetical protein J8A68_002691 [[Candida] subhashii]